MSDFLESIKNGLLVLPMVYGTHLIPACLMALSKWLLGKRMGFGAQERLRLFWFPLIWPLAYWLIPSVWLANALLLLAEYLLCRRVLWDPPAAYFRTSTLLCILILLAYAAVLFLLTFLLMPFSF